jgi:hypothetical protein
MGELATGYLTDEISGHVEIDLRCAQAHMAEVGGEQWELVAEIGAFLIPAQQPEDSKGVAEIMQSRTTAPTEVRYLGEVEGNAE